MIDKFVEYLQYEKHYSYYTFLSYRTDLEAFAAFIEVQYGSFDPLKISSNQIRSWVIALMDTGQKATSVKRKISALKSFYKFLIIKGYTTSDPTIKIIAPKRPKPLPKFFKEKDLDNFLVMSENNCNFEGVRDRLLIEVIYQTGLRRSEVSNLMDKSISLAQMQFSVIGKGNKERIIPFGINLKKLIENYLDLRKEQFGELEHPYFFVSNSGGKLSPGIIYYIVRKNMGSVTTQEKRSPHVIRHTFATSMLNSGADISSIKELLGHSTLAATQIYTHLSFEQVQNIYKQAHPRGKDKG